MRPHLCMRAMELKCTDARDATCARRHRTMTAAAAQSLFFLLAIGDMPLSAVGQCTPLAEEEPRSSTLRCTVDKPCTRFRAASGRGGGGTGLNCDHGCATEFAPVGDCVAHLIVTDDRVPGIWRSCNATHAVLDIFGPEPYPPTCTGKVVETRTYQTDGVCRRFTTPVADGPFWQMDCMTSYFPWIPPRVLAVGGTPDGAVAVSEVNATTRSITHLYAYNSSLAAVPVAGANPTDPNDGMLYFAARNPSTGKSKVVSYKPRAKMGDWSFPSAVEQDFEILGLGFFRPSLYGCDYEDPRCGVHVVADHGTYINVGEILATGVFNVTSRHFPTGTATGVSAYNQNVGAFYVPMMTATGLVLVQCVLPSGDITSAPIDIEFKILALEFDEQRDTLVGIVEKGMQEYYVAVVAPNGTVTTSGAPIAPTKRGFTIVPGVSVWHQGGVGVDSGTVSAVFSGTAGTSADGRVARVRAGTEYELITVNPFSGVVTERAMLDNPSGTSIMQLGYA